MAEDMDGTPRRAVGIECESVAREYIAKSSSVRALEDITMGVRPGQFVSLVGPSGCGKSTLLRLIAGLEAPTAGTVKIDSEVVDEPHRELGVVFQDDLLMPWRTVLANVLLQSAVRGDRTQRIRERAHALLSQVGLDGFERKYPSQLSGGMRQRVGICRAILHSPRLLLMDEPFAALDAMTRDQMAVDVAAMAADLGITVVFVTHSISEAVFLSDRVLVMSPRPGRIEADITVSIERPRSLHVRQAADFGRYVREVTEVFEGLGILRDRQPAGSLRPEGTT